MTTAHSRTDSWLIARLLALVVSVGLTACASSVPLNEVPVVDRAATAVTPLAQGSVAPPASSSGADQRSVSPVQVAPTEAPQPDALARVVYFDYDSFIVRSEFATMLEANARYLKADSKRRLSLEGHTDERGGREYNLALGQKRAEAVQRTLVLLGASEKQIEAVSFGKERPAVSGSDEAAWAQNRRAELKTR